MCKRKRALSSPACFSYKNYLDPLELTNNPLYDSHIVVISITVLEERRNLKRNAIKLPIIYAFSSNKKINLNYGTTFDINEAGMGFYTDMPLQEGLALQVHLTNIWDFPRSSVVRWCSMKNVTFYRVGLSFR